MARKKVNYYKFTPGAAGAGTVKVMGNFDLGDFLMITNVTRNIVIYNFGDPNRGGTVSFVDGRAAADNVFSEQPGILQSINNGVTTLTLDFDTSTHSASDILQVYVESVELRVRPYDFAIDAVERQRVGIPRSLIDADFEYGLQTTKWASFFTYRQTPTTYAMDGSDFNVNAFAYATLVSAEHTQALTSLVENSPWPLDVMNQGNVTTIITTVNVNGTAANSAFPFPGQYVINSAPYHYNNDYKLIVSQPPGSTGANATPAGAPGPATCISSARPITVANGGPFQRTFSVLSTEHLQINDVIVAVGLPTAPDSTTFAVGTVTASTSGRFTTNTYVTSAALVANTILAVEIGGLGTNNFELMHVAVAPAAAGAGASLQLDGARQLLGTNAGNTAVGTGGRIFCLQPGAYTVNGVVQGANQVNAVELMKVDAIDRVRNELTVTRGWFGTNANATFSPGSIIGTVNLRPFNTYEQWLANCEIVKTDYGVTGSTAFASTTAQLITAPSNPTNIGAQTVATRIGVRRQHRSGDFLANALGVGARFTGYRPGSVVINLTGMFHAGNASLPLAVINANISGIQNFSTANIGNSWISTIGVTGSNQNANVEGVFMNTISDNTHHAFMPKVFDSTKYPGYPLIPPVEQATIAPRFKRGAIYVQANLLHNPGNVSIRSNGGATSNIVIRTQNPHGVVPGTPIQVHLGGAAGAKTHGSGIFVVTHANLYYFSYLSKPVTTGAAVADVNTLSANVYAFPTALVKHRPLDGGTNIGINAPSYGFEATRQTRKYFRYQSGKGMMFTTGTQFNPVFSIANVQANTATLTEAPGAGIAISTVVEHGLQRGANVSLAGLTSEGYNTWYRVDRVTGAYSFNVLIKTGQTLATRYPVIAGGNVSVATANPRITVTKWTGAKVRGGMFDDGNGVFWEYDGQYLWAVKRSATFEQVGTVSVGVGDNRVTGDLNTRFQDNILAGDMIQLRGVVYEVIQVESQNVLYITPSYRGVVNSVNIGWSIIKEQRTRSANFNLDRLDGTGPSGYVIDLSRMQMVAIQYTWYGAGFIDWGLRATDGKMIWAHRVKNNNVNDEGYMRSGNLPARYQAVNRGAQSSLVVALTATETGNIQVAEIDEFPDASSTYPVTIMVDQELITYTTKHRFTYLSGNTQGNLGGLVREAEYTPSVMGAYRSIRGEAAGVHAVSAPVLQFGCTASPDLNHWGSAVILDGDFDIDRTYSFTFSVSSAWVSAAVLVPQTLFMIRLAPTLGSGVPGDLGVRDLLNRAQLLLQNCYINFDITAARAILQGIVNPINIEWANWQNINQAGQQFAPSFAQFVSNVSSLTNSVSVELQGNVRANPNGQNTQIRWAPIQNPNPPIPGFVSNHTQVILPFAYGGEQLFSIPVSGTNSGFIDLSRVKEIGGAIFPGNTVYPNGPEVIAFNIIPLVKNGATATAAFAGDVRVDLQLTWIESQA